MQSATQEEIQSERALIGQACQPIIRGYLTVAVAYYGVMTIAHFLLREGSEQLVLVLASTAAVSAALWGMSALRNAMSIVRLEAFAFTFNVLVLLNIFIAMRVEYDPAKLAYYILVSAVFAFACASTRQAVAAIALTLGLFSFELFNHEGSQVAIYGFVGFATAICSTAMAYYMRRSIGVAIRAQRDADRAKEGAENRLADAEKLVEVTRKQSMTDSLTGIPNRRAFFRAFEAHKRQLSNKTPTGWLVLMDLDGFKQVNDNHGHYVGDELIKAVAGRLCDYCGDSALVSRMGGDEFNLILYEGLDDEGIDQWCKGLLAEIARVFVIEDRLIKISGSIGCNNIVLDQPESRQLQNTDFALLNAKRTGKDRVVRFMEQHAADAAERFKIEQALRFADFSKEIELVFQPQFDLSTQRVVRAEALARWNSPRIGEIGPQSFIRIAEESGQIARITQEVLQKAIEALEAWDEPIPLSINLSGADLINEPVIDEMIALYSSSGHAPELLEFEITETAMMADTDKASANLQRLSQLGHPIALDDFGTGYSNFTYLRSLPIDKIKVDRSFLKDLGDPMTGKILHSLVGMTKSLKVMCVLEGVEDELGLLMAKRVGAGIGQGYHFGRPMSHVELEDVVKAGSFELTG